MTYHRPSDEYTGPYPKPYDDVPGAPPAAPTATIPGPGPGEGEDGYRHVAGTAYRPDADRMPGPSFGPSYEPLPYPVAPAPVVGRRGRKRRGRGKKLAFLAVIGAVVMVGFLGTDPDDGDGRVAAETVAGSFSSVDIDIPAGAIDVRYRDVNEARVEVNRRRRNVIYQTVDNGVLRVTADRRGPFGAGSAGGVTVVLPRSMQSTTPKLTAVTGAGDVEVEGDYGNIDLRSRAGDVEFEGGASQANLQSGAGTVKLSGRVGTIDAQSSAGGVDIRVSDATTVRARSSAGSLDVRVNGRQPDLVEARSSAGRVEIDVPDGRYRVDTAGTTGRVDVRVTSDASATQVVRASSGAGSVQIR